MISSSHLRKHQIKIAHSIQCVSIQLPKTKGSDASPQNKTQQLKQNTFDCVAFLQIYLGFYL